MILIINNIGYIGIKNSNPTYTLFVAGNSHISTDLNVVKNVINTSLMGQLTMITLNHISLQNIVYTQTTSINSLTINVNSLKNVVSSNTSTTNIHTTSINTISSLV